MKSEAVTAVALLCLSLVVFDLQEVEGRMVPMQGIERRMVPTRALYNDLPTCHGSNSEISGVTCNVVPLSHTVDDECTPRRGYIPPIHCQDPLVTAATTEGIDECIPTPGNIPPVHCQDPTVRATPTEADDECTPKRGYIPPTHCQDPPVTMHN